MAWLGGILGLVFRWAKIRREERNLVGRLAARVKFFKYTHGITETTMPGTSDRSPIKQSQNRTKFETLPRYIKL